MVYFFFDDKDERLRDAPAALRNLLAQLLIQEHASVLGHFLRETQYCTSKKNIPWTMGMLWRVFVQIAKDDKIRPIHIILDALGMHSLPY